MITTKSCYNCCQDFEPYSHEDYCETCFEQDATNDEVTTLDNEIAALLERIND